MAKNAAKVIKDNTTKLKVGLRHLGLEEVLVGVPSDNSQRKHEDGGPNNAMRAYVHDNGSPANNVPARPFMRPGVKEAQGAIIAAMKVAAKDPTPEKIRKQLNKAGLLAQSSIKKVISQGIAPALKPATIRGRKYSRKTSSRRKGEELYATALSGGLSPEQAQNVAGIIPLINTGEMRDSITYVIRRKGKT